MYCMHEIGAGECGQSAGVINVRMWVTAHRSTSIILGYCSVSFGRVAHLSVRRAHTSTPKRPFTHRIGGCICARSRSSSKVCFIFLLHLLFIH